MDWEQVARTVAPTVASALLGPMGGVATNIIGDYLFGATADKRTITPQAVMKKIASISDPADIEKLREADAALRKFEAENNFRFAQLDLESQQGARTMRVSAFASGNKTSDHLAWLTVISFLVVAALVLIVIAAALSGWLGDVRENAAVWTAVSGLLGSLVGYFSANANQVISFYFGSSAGSAVKTDQLAEHARDALDMVRRFNPPRAGSSGGGAGGDGGGGGPTVNVRSGPDGSMSATVATREPEAGALVREAVGSPPTQPMPQHAVATGDWDRCLAFVLRKEGGYANNQADRGGPTNFGITLATLAHVRGQPVSAEDVRDLTEAEAVEIYRRDYWLAARCEQLPPGVDLCVFDSVVLCGGGAGSRMLQKAAGLTGSAVDGVIGPQTLAVVKACDPVQLIDRLIELRKQLSDAIIEGDASQATFATGWMKRIDALRTEALAMAQAAIATEKQAA